MSTRSVTRFWRAVREDARLRAEYEALTGESERVPAALIVALGEKHGYAFTKRDLCIAPAPAGDREISDAELETVAGGAVDYFLSIDPVDGDGGSTSTADEKKKSSDAGCVGTGAPGGMGAVWF